MNWFEVKVKYQKVDENGKEKKVTEPYLLDAMSFTEAEARIMEEMEPFLGEVFEVANIRRANYSEIYRDETGDRWYKCKVVFVTIDEEKGKERKVANFMLVQANDMQHAYNNLLKSLEGIIVDYEISSITETPLMDVIPYFSDDVDADIPDHLKPVADLEEEVEDEEEVAEEID